MVDKICISLIVLYLFGAVVAWGHFTSRADIAEQNYVGAAPMVSMFWPFYVSDQIWTAWRAAEEGE